MYLLNGALLIILGIWMLKMPGDSFNTMARIVGIIVLISGLLESGLSIYLRKAIPEWGWSLVAGVVDLLLGAFLIANRYLGSTVDTIFEIGGQDSKFISLQDGIVTDFTMNEACAAGTGSFLEEQAEKLDVNIIDEFSRRAFESQEPIRLGERCTVYMEMDISSYQQKGAEKQNLIAGLSYSVVQNYLNRVVRGRHIGNVIFFQGGTAYNDSVAAAFSQVLGKQIIVPPHNGVVGAIGMAILAKEKIEATGGATCFNGWDIDQVRSQN